MPIFSKVDFIGIVYLLFFEFKHFYDNKKFNYMKRFLGSFFEVVEVALIALVTVFLVRTFLLQPFLVNGASMEPNFKNGDYLLVDELTYRLREPKRGEVVVFKYPGDESTYYIKRIIGLPGERVKLDGAEITVYNDSNEEGLKINENYLNDQVQYIAKDYTLKDDEFFVLGDNRSYSFDSRSWGPLIDKELIGLVRVRLWPVTNASIFETPIY